VKLLIVRHAIAEDGRIGLGDRKRALTQQGREKMERAVQGLSRLVDHIDIIAHSPLVRARETGEILHDHYPNAERMEIEELEPGGFFDNIGDRLDLTAKTDVVALVGHEPDLSSLIGWLTIGKAESFVRMKKGGIALLECFAKPGPAAAELQWLLTPGQLRMLADL
jgi:phosphohistidine phosphatase